MSCSNWPDSRIATASNMRQSTLQVRLNPPVSVVAARAEAQRALLTQCSPHCLHPEGFTIHTPHWDRHGLSWAPVKPGGSRDLTSANQGTHLPIQTAQPQPTLFSLYLLASGFCFSLLFARSLGLTKLSSLVGPNCFFSGLINLCHANYPGWR